MVDVNNFYIPKVEPVKFTPNTEVGEVKGQPDNKNFLSEFGYKFQLMRLPTVEFFCQSVTIPSLTLGSTVAKTPFTNVILGGDHIKYGIFPVTFKVDEDMKNWEEIFNWMVALAPQEQLDNQATRIINSQAGTAAGVGRTSDATVMILTNLMNPNFYFYFKDMVPLTLSEVKMDSTQNNVKYITCSATFEYRSYKIIRDV